MSERTVHGNLLGTLMVQQRCNVEDALDLVHDVVVDRQNAIHNLHHKKRKVSALTFKTLLLLKHIILFPKKKTVEALEKGP